MERSRPRRQLTDEDIQEIIFLPDGDISNIDFDSDPDHLEYDPRQDRRFLETCPLEIVTNLRDVEEPQVESNDVPSGSSEISARTSATSGKKNTAREASLGDHKAPHVKSNYTSSGLSGELPHKPSANSSNEKKTKQKKSSRIWKKKDLAIEDCSWKAKLSEPPEDVLSLFEYFSTFFDNEMIDALRYQTNLYSTQINGNCISVTHEEMRKYLSILVISGIVRMPHFRMFWHSGTRFAPVADLMSRNRFEAIYQCLHMNDNLEALPRGTDGYDRLFKVRPLLDELRKT